MSIDYIVQSIDLKNAQCMGALYAGHLGFPLARFPAELWHRVRIPVIVSSQ